MKFSEAFIEAQRSGLDLIDEINKLPMNEHTMKVIVLAQHHLSALRGLQGNVKAKCEHALATGDI